MAVRDLVVLFDIDGTLVTCHGAGRAAIEAAFADVTGDRDALSDLRFEGMTDRAIVRAGLRRGTWSSGGADDEAVIDEILGRYLVHLPPMLASRQPRVFPGAEALLGRLVGRVRTAVGLGTGNIAAGARHKLAAVGLWQHFGFGGFGSDREDRPQLLEVGARRGARALGVPRDRAQIVIIGDTPKDVAGASAIGARSLAVATSRYDLDALRAAGADLAVPDLSDDAALRFFQ